MANYRAIVRHFPAAQDYLQQRKWIRRGDVLAYTPGLRSKSFSTDAFGFRHTSFEGRDVGLGQIDAYPKVGLVLGSSHLFGFGLAGNDETLPSRLSALLGYPVFGIAYPEADTRTLSATLLRLLRQFPGRIAAIVLLTGGDFTRYCYTQTADQLFGPPLLPVAAAETHADAQRHFADLLHFTGLWSSLCVALAAQTGARFFLGDDSTFFEKSEADATEIACSLGDPRSDKQAKRFTCHRQHAGAFGMERRRLADKLSVPLIRYPEPSVLRFVDEYHYRAESQRLIAERLAEHMA